MQLTCLILFVRIIHVFALNVLFNTIDFFVRVIVSALCIAYRLQLLENLIVFWRALCSRH